MNPLEPKRSAAQCSYCARAVGDCVRFRCNECPDEVELCPECFSVGAEVAGHTAGHAYRVVDSLSFPFLTFDWSAEEELALLEGLEAFGPSNWTEVAEHVGSKSKTQCHAHYTECYLLSPTAPQPDLSQVLGKEAASALAEAQDALQLEAALAASAAAMPEAAAAAAVASAPPCGSSSSFARARAGLEAELARQALLAGFARPPEAEGGSAEVTGFNPKRCEFETEYDNEAELPLADLDFRREDSAEERQLKLRQVAVYNERLDARLQRRAFCAGRGLLNVKRLQAAEKRRAPEERELAQRCRWAARLQSPLGHEALLEGLAQEARLRGRLAELCDWRRAGCASLAEGEAYESERRRRQAEQARRGAMEQQAAADAAARASAHAHARAVRLLGRDGGGAGGLLPPGAAPPPVPLAQQSSLSTREAAKLFTDSKLALPGMGPPPSASGGRRPRGALLDLCGLPGVELLGCRERELCAAQEVVPLYFLQLKRALLLAAVAASGSAEPPQLPRCDAQALFSLDALRGMAVYDLLCETGVISGGAAQTNDE